MIDPSSRQGAHWIAWEGSHVDPKHRAILVPVSAGAQTDAFCTAVYDADGTRVARATTFDEKTWVYLVNQGRVVQLEVLLLDTYAHVLPTMQQQAANRLDALLFGGK